MSYFLISAAHKSSGKTTLSIGLCAALTESGSVVQPFKKGPDYIDPMWLSKASQRPCHNLDFYTMQQNEILNTVAKYSKGADISIIEGNKGLYDGLDLDGSNSNAALASLLNAPVILVLDARGMTRGIAPLILGYQAFGKNINIAGVILNQLGGTRHEQKLHSVIEHYTDVKVIGSVYKNSALSIDERHLGLMPSNEDDSADIKINQIRDIIKDQVDLNLLRGIASQTPEISPPAESKQQLIEINSPLRIGIIQDAVFGFYYPGDLDAIRATGAQLVTINAITNHTLPVIDALFIGGGFPETRIKELQANKTLRSQIKQALEGGLPCYAECGGLMYLSRQLSWKDQTGEMVGFLPADCIMHKRPQGRGYVKLLETADHPWNVTDGNVTDDIAIENSKTTQTDETIASISPEQTIAAHEFHYSALENLELDVKFAYQVKRGSGINGESDGIVINNTLACYAHLRDTAANRWATRFISFVQHCKNNRNI
ncbi:Protein similar to cobyrinic acid a,c-diamide synthetase clustered with dissimilatory sulfite reductase [hydrothermal vent metagenome]|uniref:Protein similar to cobyrinic acid a,c-diamide synthetase clustered with dissimilatory sulfite reductase n=1 Tax=hydrothermal vent metagenome TaxID=652676 RepID=A0A3B0WI44_9ZZZZ